MITDCGICWTYPLVLNGYSPVKDLAPSPEVIKLFPCSTQLSTKFNLLIHIKLTTIVGILTFISLSEVAFIINATSERLKARHFSICRYFSFYEQMKFRAQLS